MSKTSVCQYSECKRGTDYRAMPKSMKEKGREKRHKRFLTSLQKCTDNSQKSEKCWLTSIDMFTEAVQMNMLMKHETMSQKPESLSNTRFIVKTKEMRQFFKLTEDVVVQAFLKSDGCMRLADKYLLAMVFAYFKRASLTINEFTRLNFFIALYLAHDVEEDEEEIKYEIFPWILGENWRHKYRGFLMMRNVFLRRIDYKAIVSRRCCDEIMSIDPQNFLWKRERPLHHGGAIRSYLKDRNDDDFPRGPLETPRNCVECSTCDSQYDSASSFNTSWYISSQESAMDALEENGKKGENDDIWPSVEE